MRARFFFDFVHMRFTRLFIFVENRVFKVFRCVIFHRLRNCFIDFMHVVNELFFADFSDHFLLESNQSTNFFMAEHDRVQDRFFRNFLCAALDHQNRVIRTGNCNHQIRFFALLHRRIDHEITVHPTYLNAGNRTFKRNIRDGKRRRGAEHRRHFRCIVLIDGKHRRDHVHVVAYAFIKQRANRAINQARVQNRGFTGSTFAFYKSAGNFPYGIQFFFIIYRQREKVRTLARLFGAGRSDQHGGIPVAHHDGTTCLFGKLAGFDNQRASRPFCFEHLVHVIPPIFLYNP